MEVVIAMDNGGLLERIRREKLGISADTLEEVLLLAVEIAREGREGRKIGTMLVIGDTEEVMRRSKPLILDPLLGHTADDKRLDNHNMRETVKELAQLDGAFVVNDEGVVVSAARYISASAEGIDLPLGLGSRHMAAASISKRTNAVAVVVSESSVVRIFDEGEVISEILPELWLLRRHGLDGTYGSYQLEERPPAQDGDE
jgi:DNA integrity scanning protein DisA with diadenylate cyclase activity